jgi:uncharacterized small protein (DUF1192 family)
MAKDDEFLAPREPSQAQHVVGESLASLSVAELADRITVLRSEIERMEIAMAHKKVSRADADAFFKSNLT